VLLNKDAYIIQRWQTKVNFYCFPKILFAYCDIILTGTAHFLPIMAYKD